MKQRLLYLIKFYLLTVLIFIIAKVVFMVCNATDHPFAAGDVADVIRSGLSLDLSTALYLIIIPFLATMVSVWWQGKVLLNVLRIYYLIIAIALALAFVADTSLYPFWGFKLNASVMQYLEQPEGITASVSWGYLLIRLLLIVVVALVICKLYSYLLPGKKGNRRITETIVYVVMMPLMVIGIRGGLGESTTNIGQVFFSQNQFLNHSAVNPVFSFLSSFGHTSDEVEGYDFFDAAECERIIAGAYTTESIDCDTLLTTDRPNVVVILLESCGAVFTELGGRTDIMPNLNSLFKEGVFFTRCYANSWRTDRGTLCTLSGYPSFPASSVMKMPEKSRTMPSIAKTLQAEGYSTTYLYGGDINFTNMKGYLIGTGWQRLISMDDYSSEERKTAQWGVRDDITFGTLTSLIETADKSKPFLIGYSTLSSHEPWDVPLQKLDNKIENAFCYLDQCIGDFISKLKASEAWDNTLVILLPDHSISHKGMDNTNPLRNQIPMLWLGGAVKEPRRIETICNQTDLAATLLGQMHLPHDDFQFSRDVLSKTYQKPFAVHNYNNAQLMIDSTGYILYDFDASMFIVEKSNESERMERLNKAILQVTATDLKQR